MPNRITNPRKNHRSSEPPRVWTIDRVEVGNVPAIEERFEINKSTFRERQRRERWPTPTGKLKEYHPFCPEIGKTQTAFSFSDVEKSIAKWDAERPKPRMKDDKPASSKNYVEHCGVWIEARRFPYGKNDEILNPAAASLEYEIGYNEVLKWYRGKKFTALGGSGLKIIDQTVQDRFRMESEQQFALKSELDGIIQARKSTTGRYEFSKKDEKSIPVVIRDLITDDNRAVLNINACLKKLDTKNRQLLLDLEPAGKLHFVEWLSPATGQPEKVCAESELLEVKSERDQTQPQTAQRKKFNGVWHVTIESACKSLNKSDRTIRLWVEHHKTTRGLKFRSLKLDGRRWIREENVLDERDSAQKSFRSIPSHAVDEYHFTLYQLRMWEVYCDYHPDDRLPVFF